MKQRYLLWIILCAPFLLTWCFDILNWNWKTQEETKYPIAEEICKDNWWKITKDKEGIQICLLWGRWINLEDMEEYKEDSKIIE